jgi:hypothetical protein
MLVLVGEAPQQPERQQDMETTEYTTYTFNGSQISVEEFSRMVYDYNEAITKREAYESLAEHARELNLNHDAERLESQAATWERQLRRVLRSAEAIGADIDALETFTA